MKEIKQNETGRSMVEMLGVLAIIGVLSIGSVSGYRWAMDKMAANDIVNEIKKRAIVASQQRVLNHSLDLGEFPAMIRDSYSVIAQESYKGSYFVFTLSVEGIEKGVCDKIIAQDWILPLEIELNNTVLTDTSTCGETNTILYAFNNDLSMDSTSSNVSDDSEEENKTCAIGEYLDLNTHKCVKSTCPVGQFLLGSGNCVDCPTASNPNISLTSFLDDNSCTSCSGSRILAEGSGFNYQCSYCPSPRVACGTTCCEEGKVCQVCQGSYCSDSGTCHTPDCTSDAECKVQNAATPLCDTYRGTCFAGCRDNDDCQDAGSGDWFCDLDVSSTSYSCTQKPGRGTCQPATTKPVASYTRSTTTMNWWSAENFCKALKMTMADPTTACTAEEWAQIKAEHGGYCEALKSIETNYNYYWTKRLTNSCNAGYVDLSGGDVSSSYRNHYGYYALCE